VAEYKARPLQLVDCKTDPIPLLLISCRRDFAYNTSNEERWKPMLPPSVITCSKIVIFDDCAHYPFYEDESIYGETLSNFLAQIEEPPLERGS
jgi:pimeloyl-ACP methyl ester carboxylesterase